MPESDNTDDLPERVEFYHEYVVSKPFGHPISALKVHAMQFGAVLGAILGTFAATKFRVAVDVVALRFAFNALQASLVLALAVVLFSFGIRLFPEEEASRRFPPPILSTEKRTIAMLQIRRKPHYFATALLVAWTVAAAVAGAAL